MEIEENIYEQYRDTPYKIDDKSKKQQNTEENDEDLKNFKKSEAYNKFLKNVKELLKEPNGKNISDNITLRASIDKSKQYNEQNNNFNDNKELDKKKNSLNLEEDQYKSTLDNIDKRSNIKHVNLIYKKEIKKENNPHNYDINKNNINKNENKVVYDNNNFGGSNKMQNNINLENGNGNNDGVYYNPFTSNKEQIQQQNDLKNNNINNDEEESIKLPNIILTVINDDKLNNNKKGKFGGFFKIFSKNKNNENKTNQEGKTSDLNNNNNELNELQTIDIKLRAEPKDINIDTSDKTNNKNKAEQNILLTKDKANKTEENDIINSYNFILSSILPLGDENTKNDIDLLKKGLEKKEEDEEGLIEYDNDNNNPTQLNNQNDGPFIESQNIYGENNKNENANDNDDNKKYFYLKAEPIENNIQPQNYPDEENNLGTSSEIIDFDKSEYTIRTGTNIDSIIKKKSEYCPYLLAVLLGAGGLLFLLYKSKKIREMIINLLKAVPNFFRGLFGLFGKEIEDFLEKYNDVYRFLGDILIIIGIWIVFRLFIKFVKKLKNEKK
jgi:hypothetical protein